VEVLVRPSMEEAAAGIRRAVAGKHVCIIIARCSVRYSGRASSTLGPGERVIIVKQDGSVLVHKPEGYEPVNWQPPGTVISTELRGGKLVLRAVRLRPHEELVVEVEEVLMLAHARLRDEEELEMYGSEEEIRDALVENPHLIKEGLKPVEIERRTRAGFIDALFTDSDGRLVVVEVKKGVAGADAVVQLKRYVEALKRELGREVVGILAAEKLAKGAQALLAREGLEFRRIDPKVLQKLRRTGRLI
ncbi:MAG: endonuclease NucS, partial [Thermofilaceae archaeon]